MPRNVLILGASYGSLLATKLAMAGHKSTLVCRQQTAELINREGTEVRIKLRDEDEHRSIFSRDYPDHIDAVTPEACDPSIYDLVVLAMQEPQYSHPTLKALLTRVAEARRPCLSIMNMPPLPYLKRLTKLDPTGLEGAYSDASVWDAFEPGLMSLCSPDPQAFRPPDEPSNVLHVGLPTNFKAAAFEDPVHTAMLREMERDIDDVRLDGKEVPVKLRTFESLFVPFAKWSMLMTGNYRCVTDTGVRPIAEAVHDDLEESRRIYTSVDDMARALGASEKDLVPFEKYANAARGLLKPSSAARAILAGSQIERVDRLMQLLSRALGMPNADIDATVMRIDAALERHKRTDAA